MTDIVANIFHKIIFSPHEKDRKLDSVVNELVSAAQNPAEKIRRAQELRDFDVYFQSERKILTAEVTRYAESTSPSDEVKSIEYLREVNKGIQSVYTILMEAFTRAGPACVDTGLMIDFSTTRDDLTAQRQRLDQMMAKKVTSATLEEIVQESITLTAPLTVRAKPLQLKVKASLMV